MSENKKHALVPFNETSVLKLRKEDSTLVIDTASELNKGMVWLNELLHVVIEERYLEEFDDESGTKRARTKFHPLTMKLIEERRRTIDQIFKIMGGEVQNEVQKEFGKLTAKMIFNSSKNPVEKQKYKDQAIKILEAEFHEED